MPSPPDPPEDKENKGDGEVPPADGLEGFLNPTSRYYGPFTLGQLAFNANLQEFANRIGLLVALETGNKITAEEAYEQIRRMWKQLKKSRKLLEPPSGDNQSPTDSETQ